MQVALVAGAMPGVQVILETLVVLDLLPHLTVYLFHLAGLIQLRQMAQLLFHGTHNERKRKY